MAKRKQRKIRKSIRIDGRVVSKTFTSKEAADNWYNALFNKRASEDGGIPVAPKDGVLFKDFALNEFMVNRMANYPESTWRADEQRLNDYLLPALGNMQMTKILSTHVRLLLSNLVTKNGLSTGTRSRVRALVSAIFNEALNRDEGPLVSINPTFGLSFKGGKRIGQAEPSFLHTTKDCIKYLKAARDISSTHLVIGALGLLAGLRKQEMIALRWAKLDFESHTLEVSEKFIQAAGKIVKGTKRGEKSVRYVPMGGELELILNEHRAGAFYNSDDDFVLHDGDGKNLGPKDIYNLHKYTCAKAKVEVTVHGLRHSFGREFAERSGNIGALKDILGHSNITVTQGYSALGKERLKGFKDIVSYTTCTATKPDKEGQ